MKKPSDVRASAASTYPCQATSADDPRIIGPSGVYLCAPVSEEGTEYEDAQIAGELSA